MAVIQIYTDGSSRGNPVREVMELYLNAGLIIRN